MNLCCTFTVQPLSSNNYSICFLQAIEHTFHRRSMLIAESVNHMIQHLTFMALACIDTAKVMLVHLTTVKNT